MLFSYKIDILYKIFKLKVKGIEVIHYTDNKSQVREE